jgi:uncharacterized protein
MIIDAFAFARNGEIRTGEIPIASLTRLDVLAHQGVLTYAARGLIGERGRSFVELEVQGSLTLRCERCLQPMQWRLDLTSRLWLAKDEAEADTLPIEQDTYDVVVGSEHFDLNVLIEDEVILAMPVDPKHEQCPNPLEFTNQRESSPFDVLKHLKKPDEGATSH